MRTLLKKGIYVLLKIIMKRFTISPSIAKRDSDVVESYLSEIGRISLTDSKEEVRLVSAIRNGDQEALHRLIKGNLRFVVSVAKKYQNKGLKLADLINEGNIGLIKAAHRFDATRGFKFITFAVWWVRQAILQAIAEQRRLIRLPGNQLLGISRLNQAALKLEQQLERMPTVEELAVYTGFTVDKVMDYTVNAAFTYSLDNVIKEESGSTLMEVIADEATHQTDHFTLAASLSTDLNRALDILSKRERKIIILFYGLNGYPQTAIEDMQAIFKLSKERIRQLKDKAHKTLGLNCSVMLNDYFSRNV